MSDLERTAVALFTTGVLGTVAMCVLMRACSWAEWDLLPASYSRRALRMTGHAGGVIGGSALVAGIGLLLWIGGTALS